MAVARFVCRRRRVTRGGVAAGATRKATTKGSGGGVGASPIAGWLISMGGVHLQKIGCSPIQWGNNMKQLGVPEFTDKSYFYGISIYKWGFPSMEVPQD